MHGHYGFVELVFTVGNFVFKKGEVGNGAGVVELHSVGIQAYEFYPSGNERKVGVAEYGAICLFSCAKAVVVANQGNIGHVELVHNVALPKELVSNTEVTHVTAMNNEVDVVALIYLSYEIQRLVIPALRVAHSHEFNRCLAFAFLFYLCNVMGIYVGLTADAHIIRVIVYHVAASHEQAEE